MVERARRTGRLVVLLAELAAAGWLGAGCASVEAAEPAGSGPLVTARLRGAGGSPARPIERCGPRESYDWLANRFRCPGDGENPFGGNWRAAASHRLGSAEAAHRGHIVDVYGVPCDRTRVQVYVDMYSCAPPAQR